VRTLSSKGLLAPEWQTTRRLAYSGGVIWIASTIVSLDAGLSGLRSITITITITPNRTRSAAKKSLRFASDNSPNPTLNHTRARSLPNPTPSIERRRRLENQMLFHCTF